MSKTSKLGENPGADGTVAYRSRLVEVMALHRLGF
jgi:hypothetical protein